MNVTKVLQGASRLPLTSKRGNKDFYKGNSTLAVRADPRSLRPFTYPFLFLVNRNRSSVCTGWGPPNGTSRKTRYWRESKVPSDGFESPIFRRAWCGTPRFDRCEPEFCLIHTPYELTWYSCNSQLKPYVSTAVETPKSPRYTKSSPPTPFAPNILHQALRTLNPSTNQPLRIKSHDTKTYSKWYRSLTHEQRTRIIAETRKGWYESMVAQSRSGLAEEAVSEEEQATRFVESNAPSAA
jgi:hypothetical protein